MRFDNWCGERAGGYDICERAMSYRWDALARNWEVLLWL